jgi:hypothetical protein
LTLSSGWLLFVGADDYEIANGPLRCDKTTGGYDMNTGINRTDRLFTIGDANGNSATLESSAANTGDGWNALQFTGTGVIAFGSAAPHTSTLTGSHTGLAGYDPPTRSIARASVFAPVIGDDPTGNPTCLAKTGPGVWNVAAANDFSGSAVTRQALRGWRRTSTCISTTNGPSQSAVPSSAPSVPTTSVWGAPQSSAYRLTLKTR